LTNKLPLPIVVSLPFLDLRPINNNSCDSIHLSPQIPSTPRCRHSCSPSRSCRIVLKLADSIEIHQVHSSEKHFKVMLMHYLIIIQN
ncbi:16546_t:CDS:1, partial [Gigaspora margarita]